MIPLALHNLVTRNVDVIYYGESPICFSTAWLFPLLLSAFARKRTGSIDTATATGPDPGKPAAAFRGGRIAGQHRAKSRFQARSEVVLGSQICI